MIVNLARVHAAVGEPDAALDQIERLLSSPAKFSSKLLELDQRGIRSDSSRAIAR